MKNARTLLKTVKQHLATAKALLKEKSRAVRQAKDQRQKETAKLARDTIEAAVEDLESHRKILSRHRSKECDDRT